MCVFVLCTTVSQLLYRCLYCLCVYVCALYLWNAQQSNEAVEAPTTCVCESHVRPVSFRCFSVSLSQGRFECVCTRGVQPSAVYPLLALAHHNDHQDRFKRLASLRIALRFAW